MLGPILHEQWENIVGKDGKTCKLKTEHPCEELACGDNRGLSRNVISELDEHLKIFTRKIDFFMFSFFGSNCIVSIMKRLWREKYK